MFEENKYARWYFQIVEKARNQCRIKAKGDYFEKHHIIPKSLGGSNAPDNLVLLTFKEHFICHRLLCKMTSGPSKRKMQHAVATMVRKSCDQHRNITARHFEIAKRHRVEAQRGRKFTEEQKAAHSRIIKESWTNADERKQVLSERTSRANKGKPKPQYVRAKISQTLKGRKPSLERNKKISEVQKKVWIVTKQSGEKITIADLNAWCDENGYRSSSISNLKANRIKYHKDIIAAHMLP